MTLAGVDAMSIADQFFELGDVSLQLGGTLKDARLAYITLGRLNDAADNAVLLLHGYTASHRFILPDDPDNAEGSWGPLIGPGKAIDTRRYFILAPNALGSSYGSTGPADINPATDRRWGPDFPELTLEDQVNSQLQLLNALGVRQMHAVIGLSMGGFGAFQWAVQHPAMMRKVVPVLSAPWGSLNQVSSHQGVSAILQSSAAWHDGWYYGQTEQMQQTLQEIRVRTLERYGVPNWLATHLPDTDKVQARLDEMARQWARRFDANALLTLRAAINRFDVRDSLALARAELLYVLCRSDTLFPPSIAGQTLSRWAKQSQTRGLAQYIEIDSGYGHYASSLDWPKWSSQLENFLNQ